MKYKFELGIFGNLERTYSELTKTNNKIFNTQGDVERIDSEVNFATYNIALIEEALCEMDIANAEWTAAVEDALCELDMTE